jgi:hypothetical protein
MVHVRNYRPKQFLIKAKAEHLAWYRTGLGFVKGKYTRMAVIATTILAKLGSE